jgi:hypothetical protein
LKSFWEGVKLGFKTLFSKPIQYLTNPVKATSDVYADDLRAKGYSDAEVGDFIEVYHESGGVIHDVGEAYGSITSGIGSAIRNLGGLLNFAGRNIVIVLIVIGVIIAGWYLWLAKGK